MLLPLLLAGCFGPHRYEEPAFGDQRLYTLAEVDSYYADATKGLIGPAPSRPPVDNLIFRRTATDDGSLTEDFTVIGRSPDEVVQDLFTTNVPALIGESDDLLQATWDFHARTRFDESTQMGERPYIYLRAWNTLFHPPIKRLDLPLDTYVRAFAPDPRPDAAWFAPEFQESLDAETESVLTFGNDVALLSNGDGWVEKVRMAREAETFMFVAVMAMTCDDSGSAIVDELVARHAEGVDVRVILESLYANTLNVRCLRRLRRAGIPVLLVADQLIPGKGFGGFMHNKFWIRDGEEAVIGGQNVMDVQNLSTGFGGHNRDNDVLVRSGPTVTELTRAYVALWDSHAHLTHRKIAPLYQPWIDARLAEETAAGLRGTQAYARRLGDAETRMDGACRVVVQTPGNTGIATMLTRYIEAARHLIVMTSPTVRFDLDGTAVLDVLVEALRSRAAAGVEVEVVSNGLAGGKGESDRWLHESMEAARSTGHVNNAKIYEELKERSARAGAKGNRAYLTDIQTTNLRAWTYFNYLHAKQAYFDRTAVVVGSFNLDSQSGSKNHEAALVCLDEELASQMERQLTLDLVNSLPVVSAGPIVAAR
ncbi:MAG: phosphatidylserine/phosphatidylglycerophosphate/cardiolipin synthase family protein [Myxococcota bacterium]